MNRKTWLGFCAAVALCVPSASAWADLELPAASPAAKVSQRVGLTDISVEYSSPAAKGRKIWGDVVPWDKPWRTGANAATKITFSRDVSFGGLAVPAGTYAIVSFPTPKGWEIVLNKNLAMGDAAREYDAKQDLGRVKATTASIAPRERLTFLFAGTTDNDTSLDLEWEKLRVSVPIKVETVAQSLSNIKKALEAAWRPHANAARYLSDTQKDYPAALTAVDASIAIASTWLNNWIKADILFKQGKVGEARKYAQMAWDLGEKDPNFYYKDQVAKALKEWKEKK